MKENMIQSLAGESIGKKMLEDAIAKYGSENVTICGDEIIVHEKKHMKDLSKVIDAFQQSEDWAYYTDREKREMAFIAGYRFAGNRVINLVDSLRHLMNEQQLSVLTEIKSCLTINS